MEVVLGLPASGKSSRIVDPDSEAMGAFILDPDMIKEQMPEYIESHGAGADAIHFEGMKIFNDAIAVFLSGDMKGTNAILPIVSTDLDDLMNTYIKPFEEAGYNVKVKFREAEPNAAAARVVMRELGGGQLINSKVVFIYSVGVDKVYDQIKVMINSNGEPYGYEEEEELAPAAADTYDAARAKLLPAASARETLTEEEKLELQKENLELLAQAALEQIQEKQYETELLSAGVTAVIRVGIAFRGKEVAVKDTKI